MELCARKNPKQMLRRLEVFLRGPRATTSDPQAQDGSRAKELPFSPVCELAPDMEGEARLI